MQEYIYVGGGGPWKCLKNRFWGISVLFLEIPQNWERVRDFQIFLSLFPMFIVEVFPLFFEAFPFIFEEIPFPRGGYRI